MKYFQVGQKTNNNRERVGKYIFDKGVLKVDNDVEATKMSTILCRYYAAKMLDKSPKDTKERRSYRYKYKDNDNDNDKDKDNKD